MITDQPTQTIPQLPPRALAAAALARLSVRVPHLADREELTFRVRADGTVLASVQVDHPDAVAELRELAAALNLPVHTNCYTHEEQRRASLAAYGEFDGVHWNCAAYVRADGGEFAAFTRDHSTDPQEWTPAERAEYAALAGSAVAA